MPCQSTGEPTFKLSEYRNAWFLVMRNNGARKLYRNMLNSVHTQEIKIPHRSRDLDHLTYPWTKFKLENANKPNLLASTLINRDIHLSVHSKINLLLQSTTKNICEVQVKVTSRSPPPAPHPCQTAPRPAACRETSRTSWSSRSWVGLDQVAVGECEKCFGSIMPTQ